jgi:hypothetical protein
MHDALPSTDAGCSPDGAFVPDSPPIVPKQKRRRIACFGRSNIGLKGTSAWLEAAVATQSYPRGAMADHNIKVESKTYIVAIRRKSKTVWIATGNYMGQAIEARGRNENLAASAWRLASRYRGCAERA